MKIMAGFLFLTLNSQEEKVMHDLKVTVHQIKGCCDMPMKKGDYFTLEGGKIRIPQGKYFCMWALQSIMPLLPAKQRNINEEDDWLPETELISCPDPKGIVIMRIERMAKDS